MFRHLRMGKWTDGRGPQGQVVTFYSFKGGTGRTMALANVAWILAANGKRVLVADWDLESPGLHRFFHPFLDAEAINGTGGVIDLIRDYEWADHPSTIAAPGRWHEELRPGRAGTRSRSTGHFPRRRRASTSSPPAGRTSDYAVAVSGLDWDDFYDRLGGAQFFDALRADMKRQLRLHADRQPHRVERRRRHLHDPPAGHPGRLLHPQRAGHRRRGPGGPPGAGPGTARRNIRDPAGADAGRPGREGEGGRRPGGGDAPVRRSAGRHRPRRSDRRYWAAVEVPYRPFYAYEETLATFGDQPGSPNSLLAAYERLTGYITDGEVTALPPMDESLRVRGKDRFKRRAERSDDEIVLRYAPRTRSGRSGSSGSSSRPGVRVSEPARRRRVRLGSRPGARYADHRLAGGHAGACHRAQPRPAPIALAVYVTDMRPLAEFPSTGSTTWSRAGRGRRGGADAAARRPARPRRRTAQLGGRPFPGQRAGHLQRAGPQRPVHRPGGRPAELRAQLRAGGTRGGAARVALQGMGGVGKTQLAMEYAHRFQAAYDVVWWIAADPPQFIDTSLADLASPAGACVGPTVPDTARSVLQVR